MSRAAIYCRISQDKEGAGLGVQRQEQDCRALADHLGATVAEVYVDNDISAYDRRKKRPSYQRLLEAVRGGQVDVVLVWHTDRLHRSPRELEDWIDACEAHSVAVHTVQSGPLDLATPAGRAVARTLGAWARYESEHKGERQRAKYAQLVAAGQNINGGRRPFGWNADRLTHHPVEADLLRDAYHAALGGRGAYTIAQAWNAAGITTTTGRRWTMQAVRYALLNPRNAGLRTHKRQVVGEAAWEPIVDRDVWEQVKARLTSPDRPGAGIVHARRYLLTGYLTCGLCGTVLRPNRNAEAQRFGCRKDRGGCGGILIRYDPLEEFVVELLLARIDGDVDLAPEPEDGRVAARIAHVEERLRGLAAVYADGGDFLEMRAAGDRMRAELRDLRAEQAAAGVRQRLAEPARVRQEWPALDLDQRRAVVDVLLERIDVARARQGVNRWDPERLTVVWR